MSQQITSVFNTRSPSFDALPDEPLCSVMAYLSGESGSISLRGDERTVLATAAVCRTWRDSIALRAERQAAVIRLHQRMHILAVHREMALLSEYPQALVRIFRNGRTSIAQLPVLDLGNRKNRTGYCDFIQTHEMNHAVMRFHDRYGRPGIALKIQRTIPWQEKFSEGFNVIRRTIRQEGFSKIVFNLRKMEKCLQNRREGVLAIFKRYIEPESRQWSYGWNRNSPIDSLYHQRHYENGHEGGSMSFCPSCPFDGMRVHATVLSTLLTGQDPDFSLPNHHPGNRIVITNGKGLSEKTILMTALLAAIVMAHFVKCYGS